MLCTPLDIFDALDKRRRCATINIPIELLLRIAFVLNEFVGSDIDIGYTITIGGV